MVSETLYQKLLDEEIAMQKKQANDLLYTRILMALGTISVIISIVGVIMSNTKEEFIKQFSLMFIGFVLVMMGELWQKKDQKSIDRIEAQLDRTKSEEDDSIRFERDL